MDKYGNALLIEDVGATNSFMVIGNFYQALVGNKVCTFVHGWDIGGDEVDLNLGSSLKSVNHGGVQSIGGHVIGELVHYTSNGANGDADYVLTHHSADTKDGRWTKAVWDVFTNLNKASNDIQADDDADGYEIKASNLMLPLASLDLDGVTQHDGRYSNDINPTTKLAEHKGTYNEKSFENFYYDKSVKFIYVNYDNVNEEVDSIEFKSGIQNVSNEELREQIMGWASQAAVKDEQVKAVVIKRDSSDANLKNMLYVTKNYGSKEVDKDTNESFFKVQVVMFDEKGVMDDNTHDIYVNKDLKIGDFASYTKVAGTKYEDNFYRVKNFTRHNANPAALKVVADTAGSVSQVKDEQGKVVKHLLKLTAKDVRSYTGKTLTGIDAGSGAVMHKDSYILGGYRGSSTTVPNTIASAQGVIRTDKAGWLNLTGITKYDDIGNAEELLDIAGNEAKTKANVTLDILLNEAPDSDGFRTAYLIVIRNVAPVSDGAADVADGDVRMAASAAKYGTVTSKLTKYADGKYRASEVYLTAPAWADVNTANGKDHANPTPATALTSVKYTRYNSNGEPYGPAASLTSAGGSPTITWKDGSRYELSLSGIALEAGDYIVISDVVWTRAKIQFKLNGAVSNAVYDNGSKTSLPIATAGETLTVKMSNGAAIGGKYDVTGTDPVVTDAVVVNFVANSTPTAALKALGGDFVVVNVKTSATDVQPVYSITGTSEQKTIDGDNAKVTISVPTTANVAEGTPVTFTAALDIAPTANRVESYDVKVELLNAAKEVVGTLEFKGVTDTNNPTKNWKISDDIDLSDIKVTCTPNLAEAYIEEDSAEADHNTIVLSYVGDISTLVPANVVLIKADGSGNVNPTAIDKNYAPGKLELTFANDLEDGDVLTILKTQITVAAYAAATDLSGDVYTFVISTTGAGSSTKWTVEGKGVMDFNEAKELIPDQDGEPGGSNPTPVTVNVTVADGIEANWAASAAADAQGKVTLTVTAATATTGGNEEKTPAVDSLTVTGRTVIVKSTEFNNEKKIVVTGEFTLTQEEITAGSAVTVVLTAVAAPTFTEKSPA